MDLHKDKEVRIGSYLIKIADIVAIGDVETGYIETSDGDDQDDLIGAQLENPLNP